MGGAQTVRELDPVGIGFPKNRCLSESTPAAVVWETEPGGRTGALLTSLAAQPGARQRGLLTLPLELGTEMLASSASLCLPSSVEARGARKDHGIPNTGRRKTRLAQATLATLVHWSTRAGFQSKMG